LGAIDAAGRRHCAMLEELARPDGRLMKALAETVEAKLGR
jgi:hypothetical protein